MPTTVTLKPHAGGWTDTDIAGNADIAATKLRHRHHAATSLFEQGVEIVGKTQWVHAVSGASSGNQVEFRATIGTSATGADRTVDIDLQKSTGGGAFATVLTGPIQFVDGDSDLTSKTAAFGDSAMIAGDLLQVVVTVAGVAGAQAKGLIVANAIDHTT